MYTILIIEDDREISDLIALYVEGDGMKTIQAFDGEEGLNQFHTNSINLVVVDIMMPKKNGFTVIKEIRKTSNIPVIVLSSRTQKEDKVLGLNIGADDYIEKPFSGLEVVARINAQLRRFTKLGSEVKSEQSVVRDLLLDMHQMKLFLRGQEIVLTSIEYKILKLLMDQPGRVFTKHQIYSHAIGDYYESDENTIMVHISNIRSKIEVNPKEPHYIKTVRGLGYKIE